MKLTLPSMMMITELEASKGKNKRRDSEVKMSIESAITSSSPFKLKTDMLASLLESEVSRRTITDITLHILYLAIE